MYPVYVFTCLTNLVNLVNFEISLSHQLQYVYTFAINLVNLVNLEKCTCMSQQLQYVVYIGWGWLSLQRCVCIGLDGYSPKRDG